MTLERFQRLREAYRQQGCFYCNRVLTPEITTRDHFIPRSWWKRPKGRKNIRLACFACNQQKGNMHPEVFIKQKQEVVMNPQCVVHNLEYMRDANYCETWACTNCPYQESTFIECL